MPLFSVTVARNYEPDCRCTWPLPVEGCGHQCQLPHCICSHWISVPYTCRYKLCHSSVLTVSVQIFFRPENPPSLLALLCGMHSKSLHQSLFRPLWEELPSFNILYTWPPVFSSLQYIKRLHRWQCTASIEKFVWPLTAAWRFQYRCTPVVTMCTANPQAG